MRIFYLVVFTVFVVSMFTVAERLNAWEKANKYPYGMLCDVYNNCSKQEKYNGIYKTCREVQEMVLFPD